MKPWTLLVPLGTSKTSQVNRLNDGSCAPGARYTRWGNLISRLAQQSNSARQGAFSRQFSWWWQAPWPFHDVLLLGIFRKPHASMMRGVILTKTGHKADAWRIRSKGLMKRKEKGGETDPHVKCIWEGGVSVMQPPWSVMQPPWVPNENWWPPWPDLAPASAACCSEIQAPAGGAPAGFLPPLPPPHKLAYIHAHPTPPHEAKEGKKKKIRKPPDETKDPPRPADFSSFDTRGGVKRGRRTERIPSISAPDENCWALWAALMPWQEPPYIHTAGKKRGWGTWEAQKWVLSDMVEGLLVLFSSLACHSWLWDGRAHVTRGGLQSILGVLLLKCRNYTKHGNYITIWIKTW